MVQAEKQYIDTVSSIGYIRGDDRRSLRMNFERLTEGIHDDYHGAAY